MAKIEGKISLIDTITKYKWTSIFLLSLLFICFILRIYRIDQLLGFYYDQGRDALVIWDLWHNHKLFLIGPTTGIEGIYRGPWYYWLIAPFYLLGRGNPIWPSVFLSLTTVFAAFISFLLGIRIGGKWTGFISVILFTFSFNLVLSSRWLSNPTPMLLISMSLIYSLYKIMDGYKLWWIAIGFLLGLAMQFGSAAEVFYFPAVLIFALWQRKYLPTFKIVIMSLVALFSIFLPQIYFDIKHEHVLLNAIKNFLIVKQSFKASFWQMVQIRLPFYFDVFFSKLFVSSVAWRYYFSVIIGIAFIINLKNFFKNKYFITLFIMLASPIIGMLFFQGNYGNVYDYYFTGYYLIFIVLVSAIMGISAKNNFGKVLVVILLGWFLLDNLPILKSYLTSGVNGPENISLGNQVQAVDWVFRNANNREFNVDVYVPPVIPYAYNYLFLWQANKRCGESICNLKLDSNVPLLYTLYEVDTPHPERLDAWLARQKGIATVKKSDKFGGITVEERNRI